MVCFRFLAVFSLTVIGLSAQSGKPDPNIQKIVSEVSADRISRRDRFRTLF